MHRDGVQMCVCWGGYQDAKRVETNEQKPENKTDNPSLSFYIPALHLTFHYRNILCKNTSYTYVNII